MSGGGLEGMTIAGPSGGGLDMGGANPYQPMAFDNPLFQSTGMQNEPVQYVPQPSAIPDTPPMTWQQQAAKYQQTGGK